MDWFSKNFPTLAKLISILGKSSQRRTAPRTRKSGRRAGTPIAEGSPQAAEIAAPNIEERPLLVIEGPGGGEPVQAEEAPLELAPAEFGQDALTKEPGEAAPSTIPGPLEAQSPVAQDPARTPAESGKRPVLDTAVSALAEQPPVAQDPARTPAESGKRPVLDTAVSALAE